MAQIVYGDDQAGRMAREALRANWLGAAAPVRHIDWTLLLVSVGLSAFSLLMIYSATFQQLLARDADPAFFMRKQAVGLAIGLAVMASLVLFDYRFLRVWGPVAYAGSLLLLGAVLMLGETIKGAQSWLSLGPLSFQPSELAKPALIIMLAALFHERREEALGFRALVEALALSSVPMLLILRQPDFGTFMVFVATAFGVLLMARVRVRYMAALALIGVLSIVGALQMDLFDQYQVERLTSFINPESADPQGAYFNVHQAQIAIGAGQIAGQGLFEGSQTHLEYVPENHTDFIFTVVGEELGFLGSAAMLAAFAVLLWRGLRIAALSRDTFGTLVAGGVVATLAFQLFINVGMTIGIMPVTGLPLPFVSYGPTSLIASFIMVGLLQNVHMRRFG
ncbi:MAG TPA: rod shape-determining protein RodA [Egibacteraceae bacterium]|nr:rod shape-determining protein RodA [Egibacteraceae bacterium]